MALLKRNINDEELLRHISSNDKHKAEAFRMLYERYSPRVYMYCRKFFGDGSYADDVFQDTFLRFLKSAEKEVEINNVLSYLLKIARNLCINHKRDNPEIYTDFKEYYVPSNSNPLELEELNKVIEAALELLPIHHKEAFILQAYEGFSYQEIADLTNVPVSTARNWVVRAKRKIQELIAPYLENNRGTKLRIL